jgi:outer membrane protein insertion porin family
MVVLMQPFLRNILWILLSLLGYQAFAQNAALGLNCIGPDHCAGLQQRINNLDLDLPDLELQKAIKFLANDELIESFYFELFPIGKKPRLKIDAKFKRRVLGIDIQANFDLDGDRFKRALPIQEEDYLDSKSLLEIKTSAENLLRERGYTDFEVTFQKRDEGSDIYIVLKITLKEQMRITGVTFETDVPELGEDFRLRLNLLKGKVFNGLELKVLGDQMIKELFEAGFYNGKVKYDVSKGNNQEGVGLKFEIIFGKLYIVTLEGNHLLSRPDALTKIRSSLSQDPQIGQRGISNVLTELYSGLGIYGSVFRLRTNKGQSKFGYEVENIIVDIKEGKKIPVREIRFTGNVKLNTEDLHNLYNRNATSLASAGYFDNKYLESFTDNLFQEYYSQGFVMVDVSKPSIEHSKDGVLVTYGIKERQQCIVDDIVIKELSEDLAKGVLDVVSNKKGQPLNVTSLDSDIERAIAYIREQGYIFANIDARSKKDLIIYSANYSAASLNINFSLGKRVVFNDSLVTGYKKTKPIVLMRELNFLKGEVLTPTAIKKTRDRLLSLGLFSSVKITPVIINLNDSDENYKTNLIVQVREKDFGTGEIAPGYRTDIGAKLSTTILYANLWGMNHSVNLKLQANQRFNFSNLDARRKAEEGRIFEYLVSTSYSWPYFLNILDFGVESSLQRKRFFSFDADIMRVSPQFTKNFTDALSASLTYQFETIEQFDATELKDRDSFQIGSITPSIALDLRDSPVAPRKGAHLSVSYEHASPEFGAMKNDDIEIDFFKIVSRNRFYYSLGPVTFALSLSTGYQKNRAQITKYDEFGSIVTNTDGSARTVGYIPSIKVFRLDGIDSVRGFGESEINRLESGTDMNSLRLQNTAYFSTIKFEPRYLMSDSVMVGLFFDAGRLFVDHYKPLDLRTSAGASLKYVTPVGTLDFDYGVKLRREKLADGGREGFGRFHLSIGFF